MDVGILRVGDKACFQKTITEADVSLFAGISGDFNPIHISKEAGCNSIFGDRIVHGMLSASLISTVIGMQLPGPGTIYMEQNCKFKKAVYIGDTLTAWVTLIDIVNKEKGIVKLECSVLNQKSESVIEGFAIVKIDKNRLED